MKNLLLLSAVFLSLFSCGNSETADSSKHDVKDSAVGYSIDPSTMTLGWTAFKTMAKKPVKGTFKDINEKNVKIPTASSSLEYALDKVNFNIPVNSLTSGNEQRDYILKKWFFGIMTSTKELVGSIQIDPNDSSKGTMALRMNEVVAKFPISIAYEGNLAKLKGIMNLNAWKTKEAQDSLHKYCEAKHTGEDGVSKTWSDVEIYGSVNIHKTENN